MSLGKKIDALDDEKNTLRIFNSNAQDLNSDEIAFRTIVYENINQELTILSLNDKNLKDIDIKYLSECDFLSNLTSLDLRNNSLLTAEGFKYLADCSFIDKLTDFKIKWGIEGLEGIKYLSDYQFLNKITELDLSCLNIKNGFFNDK